MNNTINPRQLKNILDVLFVRYKDHGILFTSEQMNTMRVRKKTFFGGIKTNYWEDYSTCMKRNNPELEILYCVENGLVFSLNNSFDIKTPLITFFDQRDFFGGISSFDLTSITKISNILISNKEITLKYNKGKMFDLDSNKNSFVFHEIKNYEKFKLFIKELNFSTDNNLTINFFKDFMSNIKDTVNKNKLKNKLKNKHDLEEINETRKVKNEERQVKKEIRKKWKTKVFTDKKKNVLLEFDKDSDGIVDVIENGNEFKLLIEKYQNDIIDIDKSHIHDFMKIIKHIETKKQNIQDVFNTIRDLGSINELENNIGVLKNLIYGYRLLLFHSFNLVISLVNKDLITFYEIYEKFDEMNLFNSNWENKIYSEISTLNLNIEKVRTDLDKINNNISNLMISINLMEMNISSKLNNLTYTVDYSISKLNKSLTSELESINSTIKVNNLLNTIQTYQLYKINKNTKPTRK